MEELKLTEKQRPLQNVFKRLGVDWCHLSRLAWPTKQNTDTWTPKKPKGKGNRKQQRKREHEPMGCKDNSSKSWAWAWPAKTIRGTAGNIANQEWIYEIFEYSILKSLGNHSSVTLGQNRNPSIGRIGDEETWNHECNRKIEKVGNLSVLGVSDSRRRGL